MVSLSTIPLIIDGKDVTSTSDGKSNIFPVVSPFDSSQTLYMASNATAQDVSNACDSSLQGFATWKSKSYDERRAVFARAAEILKSKKAEFLRDLKNMAVVDWFAELNVDTSIEMLEEAASISSLPQGEIAQSTATNMSMIFYEPLGPILSIVPWNAPLVLCTRAIVWPLAAGCSVLLKTSEHSPIIHFSIASVLREAGLPAGALNVIHASPKDAPAVTAQLIESKAVRKINFTGSTVVGRIIAQTAAKVLKPVLMELGGKCASIVTNKANLKAAAEGIVAGGFAHNGQICMSTERVFVHTDVYDDFISYVREAAAKAAAIEHLPQRTDVFAKRIEQLISAAEKDGAELIYGQVERRDAFVKPIIFANVGEQHLLRDNETFGPVFYVNRVQSNMEAVNNVNSSAYGLSSSVWSQDLMEAIRLGRCIDSGAVHINGLTIHDEPILPHGGVKESGFGRFNGKWGVREFQFTKTITAATC